MKMYKASFDTVFLRFNLMMAVAVIPFVIGIPVLAIMALPVFLSCIFGIEFFPSKESEMPRIAVYPDVSFDKSKRADIKSLERTAA